MKYDYNEVEITRRLYRMNNEAEYLINKQSCRLKDIIDLIMDTGLGKDSLSIISQGNISSFADNKPEERRGIFEDAAGVSKYKKRKLESIRKLERTNENLERIGDIVSRIPRKCCGLNCLDCLLFPNFITYYNFKFNFGNIFISTSLPLITSR